jgi:branched-chain amino acid transport system ATP-binding protein
MSPKGRPEGESAPKRVSAEGSPSAVVLETHALSRRFGGLAAVDGVSIACRHGEVHAVIGPNGAGKSTLINLLSGDLEPSQGTVRLFGRDVTGLPADAISRLGVGRSYQKTNVFMPFTVFENCRLAAQARTPRPWAWWQSAQKCTASNDAALAVVQRAGLFDVMERPAGMLSHGQKRQLEIAMCLATEPQVLLLDEPLAGMGAEETERMLALLGELKAGHAIALVEHDMDAVFRIADRITVMVNGAVLASGEPQAVRANAEVQAAYLGGVE